MAQKWCKFEFVTAKRRVDTPFFLRSKNKDGLRSGLQNKQTREVAVDHPQPIGKAGHNHLIIPNACLSRVHKNA